MVNHKKARCVLMQRQILQCYLWELEASLLRVAGGHQPLCAVSGAEHTKTSSTELNPVKVKEVCEMSTV